MIKYKLLCKNCDLKFDSWFSSSNEFDKLQKLKLLSCHLCESLEVEKTLMTPNIVNQTNKIKKEKSETEKIKKVKRKIKEYQNFIKNNFEYVGDKFAYEARSIHYNKKMNKKGIYGNASPQEVDDLKNEGIETDVIPWINDREN